ncbi:protein eva-1 homolog B isoform X1 [Dasypus novemcinctus]|uniref:protein eva-1 homolog B isoform X1 n=1 Tax=Dasypus novemcinctus TaxID=9361 RepID=UPI00265D8436|nr:protein eva-1 homolog B isoform X1 [Dasypus novemcinctus]
MLGLLGLNEGVGGALAHCLAPPRALSSSSLLLESGGGSLQHPPPPPRAVSCRGADGPRRPRSPSSRSPAPLPFLSRPFSSPPPPPAPPHPSSFLGENFPPAGPSARVGAALPPPGSRARRVGRPGPDGAGAAGPACARPPGQTPDSPGSGAPTADRGATRPEQYGRPQKGHGVTQQQPGGLRTHPRISCAPRPRPRGPAARRDPRSSILEPEEEEEDDDDDEDTVTRLGPDDTLPGPELSPEPDGPLGVNVFTSAEELERAQRLEERERILREIWRTGQPDLLGTGTLGPGPAAAGTLGRLHYY